jgi:hypothetical protein
VDVAAIVLTPRVPNDTDLAATTNAAALRTLVPHVPVVEFPHVADTTDLEALASAADLCGLDAALLESPPAPKGRRMTVTSG